MRLDDLDLPRRILRLRKPKGGEEKAFDFPLSRAMVGSTLRLRRLGPVIYPEAARTCLFPSDATSGHLEEHKEDRVSFSRWVDETDFRWSNKTAAAMAA